MVKFTFFLTFEVAKFTFFWLVICTSGLYVCGKCVRNMTWGPVLLTLLNLEERLNISSYLGACEILVFFCCMEILLAFKVSMNPVMTECCACHSYNALTLYYRLILSCIRGRYSDQSQIARSMKVFEDGTARYLLVTERFYFFRRYVGCWLWIRTLPCGDLLLNFFLVWFAFTILHGALVATRSLQRAHTRAFERRQEVYFTLLRVGCVYNDSFLRRSSPIFGRQPEKTS